MKRIIAGIMCCLLASGIAQAEKADALKQGKLTATGKVVANTATNGLTVEDDVVFTRGTMIVKAGKAVTKEDPEGYIYATFYAPPGGLATFRQKQDGGDFWFEGEAERIEYDGKLEIIKFFSKARVAQLEGTKVTRQGTGPFISYNSRTEIFEVINSVSGESKKGGGRVEFIFEPRRKAPAAATPAPASVPTPAPVTK